ncbi:hypothetical protein HHK36_019876 [Tetracentron sinense]|uniref:1,3-beta-glucan synthase component FKS1-like domain-containing protein n=1 Tax=Tetracentron sinense TaxID=13715 RepID=A0A834YZT0_TETSI|nr:hypothetical protein HHK36_019876 [Tetracentron sinense]
MLIKTAFGQIYVLGHGYLELNFGCGEYMEAANNDNGRAPHSAWRNYDDFNEYF